MKHLQTVTCHHCKVKHVLAVEAPDWEKWLKGRSFTQDVFPYLTAAERELLISGYCGDCWNLLFPESED
jgi:hypothetical protein